jgi:putative intracellular protease/amidase
VIVASPEGGASPVDPRSLPDNPSAQEKRLLALLKDTRPLSDLDGVEPDGIFFAGGHGTMFDFPTDPSVQNLVSTALQQDQPLALVCHGPAALVGAKTPAGTPPIKNRTVTGFTNSEERAVQLQDEVPFLLETKLEELGATFIGGKNFQEHVVVDRNLVTGQNPASSRKTAEELLKLLKSD